MITNTIIYTNSNGDSVTFAPNRHLRMLNGFDLSALSATINQSNSTKNGASYQNTKLDTADFDIEFAIHRSGESQAWIESMRHELFKVFNPLKNPIRIDFVTKGGKEYYIDAELTATPSLPQGFENNNRSWQKGLLQFVASNPFIYEKDEIKTDVALWVSNFEFPLEVFESGIELGYRSQALIVNVQNNGSDDTGMIMRFRANNQVVKPKLLNVTTYEEFKLNFTMLAGDVIEISTFSGKRTATLIRNDVRSNIFGYIDLSSKFLQLRVGDNLFRYDAENGVGYLEVSIIHRNTLVGV